MVMCSHVKCGHVLGRVKWSCVVMWSVVMCSHVKLCGVWSCGSCVWLRYIDVREHFNSGPQIIDVFHFSPQSELLSVSETVVGKVTGPGLSGGQVHKSLHVNMCIIQLEEPFMFNMLQRLQ